MKSPESHYEREAHVVNRAGICLAGYSPRPFSEQINTPNVDAFITNQFKKYESSVLTQAAARLEGLSRLKTAIEHERGGRIASPNYICAQFIAEAVIFPLENPTQKSKDEILWRGVHLGATVIAGGIFLAEGAIDKGAGKYVADMNDELSWPIDPQNIDVLFKIDNYPLKLAAEGEKILTRQRNRNALPRYLFSQLKEFLNYQDTSISGRPVSEAVMAGGRLAAKIYGLAHPVAVDLSSPQGTPYSQDNLRHKLDKWDKLLAEISAP